jgi:hypothetical protein
MRKSIFRQDYTLLAVLYGLAVGSLTGEALAQEVKAGTLYGNMNVVTQDMLSRASGDANTTVRPAITQPVRSTPAT